LIFRVALQIQRESAWMGESDERLRGRVMMLFLRTLCWATCLITRTLSFSEVQTLTAHLRQTYIFSATSRRLNA